MKVSKEEKKEFFKRKEVLSRASDELKKEFVGLDDIIDEIINLIEPWYLFPNGQIRPTIINLWGMTGVGKTSLVKRLFEHLDLKDSLYKFDVGDYASQDNNKLSYSFSEKLKNREKQQIGLIFDEFQLGRTIDEQGVELEKSGLRAMWDVLDSGKISILQSSFYGTRIYQLSLKLEDCVENGGVKCKGGKVTENLIYHEKYFKEDEESDVEIVPKSSKKKKDKKEKEKEERFDSMFVPTSFYWYIQMIWEHRFLTERELKEYLKTMDEMQTIDFLNETLKRAFKPMEYDYSTSCIFVIGNIDEAYKMAKNFDPDSDADRFYRHSLKITLPQIKGALQRRFRAEQIARLGNNHIIYPAFSSQVYKDLISMELEKVRVKVKDRFSISIDFDDSINDIIYKEGVFPTQGARPVFTTITSVIESYVGKIVKDILESKKKVKYIKWKYKDSTHFISYYNKKGKEVFKNKHFVRLKVELLRRSDSSQLQAQVAVHEAGHAVAAIFGANVMPSEIVSRTANMSEGHCAVEIPTTTIETKDWYIKDIIVSLGGHVAEELIFGEDKLSNGTSGDFQRASRLALEMAKSFGMLGLAPMLYGPNSASANDTWSTKSFKNADGLAEKVISDCKKKCKEILEKDKYLLLKIAEYLSNNSRMDGDKIREYYEKYGSEEIEIKDKDNYHTFKEVLEQKISEEEDVFSPKKGGSRKVSG